MSGKHKRIAELEIELIAKRAKQSNAELTKEFIEMHETIEKTPEDIEEMTKIKEFMARVPTDIEKLKIDITLCMEIYDVLNEFNYQFKDNEDYDRKWDLFGAPKRTLEKIEAQKLTLENEKNTMITVMQ